MPAAKPAVSPSKSLFRISIFRPTILLFEIRTRTLLPRLIVRRGPPAQRPHSAFGGLMPKITSLTSSFLAPSQCSRHCSRAEDGRRHQCGDPARAARPDAGPHPERPDADGAGNIYEGLLRYSEKLEPQPGLAESWTISADAKVYTFKLKQGVTWHDGKPFTAADVLFSIEMLEADPRACARQLCRSKRSRRSTTTPSSSR